MNLDDFTDQELSDELARREWVRSERQARVYRGELPCTDAPEVVGMEAFG